MGKFRIRDAEPDQELVATDGKLVLVDVNPLRKPGVTRAQIAAAAKRIVELKPHTEYSVVLDVKARHQSMIGTVTKAQIETVAKQIAEYAPGKVVYVSKSDETAGTPTAFEKFLKKNAKSRLFRRRIATEAADA